MAAFLIQKQTEPLKQSHLIFSLSSQLHYHYADSKGVAQQRKDQSGPFSVRIKREFLVIYRISEIIVTVVIIKENTHKDEAQICSR